MNKTSSIFVRINPTIKAEAEKVINSLGLSMASAIEIYLRQIAIKKKIPFELSIDDESLNDNEIHEFKIGDSVYALLGTAKTAGTIISIDKKRNKYLVRFSGMQQNYYSYDELEPIE